MYQLYRPTTPFFSSHASNITYVRVALRSSMIPMFLKESAEWKTEHGHRTFRLFIVVS